MRKKMLFSILLIHLLCATLSTAYAQETLPAPQRKPITKQLIDIVNHNTELKTLLIKSIEKAKTINPRKDTNPAQTLDEYYDFIDYAATAVPWLIVQGLDLPDLRDKIDQSLAYFYFISDMQLKELEGLGLYSSSLQYYEPYRSWLIAFTKEYGAFLDSESSWNAKYLRNASDEEAFGLKNEWYESSANWKTFNQFFSRKLASPEKRPIAEPENNAVVVSPTDSTPHGSWQIDKSSSIMQKEGVLIKSRLFNSVAALLGEDSEYKNAFALGTLTHTKLAATDYHRFHSPVGGTVKDVRLIPADSALGGAVEWNPYLERYVVSSETPGWQSLETRACIIIETAEHGLIALLPVGMGHRSSVNFEPDVKVGMKAEKGDPLGYFLFGGSDFVMIFQKDARFRMTVPKELNGKSYSHILMGTEYGRFLAE